MMYPAYAEAVLLSWAGQNDGETFVKEFCDWAWENLQTSQKARRSAAVELFLKEFLGGQDFDLATAVKVNGLSGSQIRVPLLNMFVTKLASEEHHKCLEQDQLKRLQSFIAYLLNSIVASILNARKKEKQEAEVRKIKEEILSRAPWKLGLRRKHPSKVLLWLEEELFQLESSFVKGFWEEGAEKGRLARRKVTYPAYAEAVLQSWADQSDRDEFVEKLCDWAWCVMSDQERPLLRRAAVELFLEEFLGGEESDLATTVNFDGLSGSQILVPLLNKFVAKTATEEHHKCLNKEQLRRLETLLENLLYNMFTSILNGRKKEAEAAEVRKVQEEILNPSAPSSEQTPRLVTFGAKQQPWNFREAKVTEAQPFAVRSFLAEDESLKARKAPAVVIAWVDEQIRNLDLHFDEAAKGYAENAEARKERQAKRKALYPLFADALLQSCLDGNEESFTEQFCEWVWRSIACHPRESRRMAEIELFLQKFLAGKTSKAVSRDGLCGADLAGPVFQVFVSKLTASGERLDLDPKERERIRDFLRNLLNRLEKAISKDLKKFDSNKIKAQKMKEAVLKQAPWMKKM
ncbi:hypothetical protein KFL_002100100 [Klebsormidium nitens]|uniref:Uncharacterized protein n=1 Tax=Klebsormidium nitens TaxID=105231 RepID=A0A1Y1I1T4_KLENI|nr:hypothetical protein KFL_002100100 [Klebsormidium nitens]|eukprot:GAQ84880.1 hypothetical protein KFL_002100100 [Klebsormidium nitens]